MSERALSERALSEQAHRTVRPVDAAGLVLIRDGAEGPEVLLGRRHRRTKFLPDIYVFPGGRVDPGDRSASGFPEHLHPGVNTQLRLGSRREPQAFARAAIRETFEETGLLLGGLDAHGCVPAAMPVWQAFGKARRRPAFEALDFLCRAITPTYSTRRYNTRFFLADGAAVGGQIVGNGELEDLGWWPLAELGRLAIVDVTAFVLAEALRRRRERAPVGRDPARLYCYRGDAARWRIPACAGSGGWQVPPERVFA